MAEDENGTATVSYQDVDAEVDVVRVVEGPDAGLTALLHDEPLRIGTGEGMDLRLSDRGISRGHCRLVREAGHVRVVDLGSKNGTWIAGCRVRDADLPAGTRLRLSSTAIELSVDKCRVRAAVWTGGNRFGEVVGRAPSTHRLFVQLARIADASGAVLICGETGTGKDVVARTIHSRGPRANAPFVVVDGGALSRALADSELFGHVRGAFTDAVADRAGAFERAHGGTLFIDEIGDLPLDVQPKLLRALDRGEVHRVGSSERTRCDVRVIAATHRSLDRMVNERSFREDLLRRLSVFEVRLPPLRERPEDIPLLAVSFLTELGMRDPALAVSLEQALAARAGHTWPGNVRELRGFVRRFLAFGDAELGAPLPPDDAPPRARVELPWKEAKAEWIEALERLYFGSLLAETAGNVTKAARRAEIDRNHLAAIALRHGLRT